MIIMNKKLTILKLIIYYILYIIQMSNFFKKISKGTTNMFSKIDKGADNMFSKAKSFGNKVGSNIENVGDKVAGVGRQAGNFLEKNSRMIGQTAGDLAAMAGAPEMSQQFVQAGNMGKEMGQRLKQGSEAIRDASNRTGSLVRSQVQNASDKAMMAKSNLSNQINSKIGMAQQQALQARSQALSGLNNMTESINPSFH
jgi:predicted PurR-regulated permease PerM